MKKEMDGKAVFELTQKQACAAIMACKLEEGFIVALRRPGGLLIIGMGLDRPTMAYVGATCLCRAGSVEVAVPEVNANPQSQN